LAEFHDNGAGYDYFNWCFDNMRLLDGHALGTRKLHVRNQRTGSQGTRKSRKLVIHGATPAGSTCTGDPLLLDTDFIAQVATCTSSRSMSAGNGILLHSIVTLKSSEVILQGDFRVESDSRFHVKGLSWSSPRQ